MEVAAYICQEVLILAEQTVQNVKRGLGSFFFYSYQVPFEFYNILSDPYKMTERSYHTNAMGGNAFLWRDL